MRVVISDFGLACHVSKWHSRATAPQAPASRLTRVGDTRRVGSGEAHLPLLWNTRLCRCVLPPARVWLAAPCERSALVGGGTCAAPEVLLKQPYSFPVDIFSMGVITYILLCGYPPFFSDKDDDRELYDQTVKGNWTFEEEDWESVSDAGPSLPPASALPLPRPGLV
jgi:serine/threonine protein kinase